MDVTSLVRADGSVNFQLAQTPIKTASRAAHVRRRTPPCGRTRRRQTTNDAYVRARGASPRAWRSSRLRALFRPEPHARAAARAPRAAPRRGSSVDSRSARRTPTAARRPPPASPSSGSGRERGDAPGRGRRRDRVQVDRRAQRADADRLRGRAAVPVELRLTERQSAAAGTARRTRAAGHGAMHGHARPLSGSDLRPQHDADALIPGVADEGRARCGSSTTSRCSTAGPDGNASTPGQRGVRARPGRASSPRGRTP